MSTQVGLWIDHKKASIVILSARGEEAGLIISKVERQRRRSGDSPLKGSYDPIQVPADDTRQNILTSELNHYYDSVIAAIGDADQVLIFGPGKLRSN